MGTLLRCGPNIFFTCMHSLEQELSICSISKQFTLVYQLLVNLITMYVSVDRIRLFHLCKGLMLWSSWITWNSKSRNESKNPQVVKYFPIRKKGEKKKGGGGEAYSVHLQMRMVEVSHLELHSVNVNNIKVTL